MISHCTARWFRAVLQEPAMQATGRVSDIAVARMAGSYSPAGGISDGGMGARLRSARGG